MYINLKATPQLAKPQLPPEVQLPVAHFGLRLCPPRAGGHSGCPPSPESQVREGAVALKQSHQFASIPEHSMPLWLVPLGTIRWQCQLTVYLHACMHSFIIECLLHALGA